MVEYTASLDSIFASLAHPTRRDILRRLQDKELSVNEIAAPYSVSLAAISKHLNLLQKAHLIVKRIRGTTHFVALEPATMHQAMVYLQQYEANWQRRLDNLDAFLEEDNK